MFRSLILLLSILSASAFAPTGRAASSSLKMLDFSKEVGAQAPLGFWDPLGLLKNADQERFDTLRRYEVKHGRVAMLAVLGHIVTAKGDRLPGDIAFGVPFSSMKTGIAAFYTIPPAGLLQLFIFVGIMETGFAYAEKYIADGCTRAMTGYGWDEKMQKKKAAIELNNGRAAQMGILGLAVHERINNDPYVLNSLLGMPVPFNQ